MMNRRTFGGLLSHSSARRSSRVWREHKRFRPSRPRRRAESLGAVALPNVTIASAQTVARRCVRAACR